MDLCRPNRAPEAMAKLARFFFFLKRKLLSGKNWNRKKLYGRNVRIDECLQKNGAFHFTRLVLHCNCFCGWTASRARVSVLQTFRPTHLNRVKGNGTQRIGRHRLAETFYRPAALSRSINRLKKRRKKWKIYCDARNTTSCIFIKHAATAAASAVAAELILNT